MILRAFRVNRRMHNKAWIADGRIAIVGGRNIGDAYFGAGSPANFRDLDLLLLGRAVAQTERVFDAYWNSAATIPLLRLARRRASHLPRLRRHLESLLALCFQLLHQAGIVLYIPADNYRNCTFLREYTNDAFADALGTAGYENNFIF